MLCVGALAACAIRPAPPGGIRVVTAPAPSDEERFCAWYGHAAGPILYFGQSGFWAAFRASGGRPEADLDRAGPALIGRFDLAGERLLPSIDVAPPPGEADRSGVWDVFAHANGRIYFTTFFGLAGSVDPATGAVERFPGAGRGLNEIAAGPDGNLIVSRYGSTDGGNGSLVVLRPDGGVVSEYPLAAPAGLVAAPKTIAYDPTHDEFWLTTDMIPSGDRPDAAMRHDTVVLDRNGREISRFESPEVQFVAFDAGGTGYRAEVTGAELTLHIVPPRGAERRIPLDRGFATGVDFVQDIQFSDDGRVTIARWSGWVHVADPDDSIRSVRLPVLEPPGLYYTAVTVGERLCATHCGDVTVVCEDLESGRGSGG